MDSNKTAITNDIKIVVKQDFILEKGFLDKSVCDKLISYFNDSIKYNKSTNVNPMYDNRIVYYEHIKNPTIRDIIKTVQEKVANKLMEFYGCDADTGKIYPESSHIVIWNEGDSLGDHADAYYEDGTPNYTFWRTHSAVVYLNDNYSGGEFYFSRDEPIVIKPEVGTLLGFTAGMDHVHGVKMVEAGTRYALPMWFSSDKSRIYPEYR